jgi:hypothetical protein
MAITVGYYACFLLYLDCNILYYSIVFIKVKTSYFIFSSFVFFLKRVSFKFLCDFHYQEALETVKWTLCYCLKNKNTVK